jgi:sec-independent protein translocase protein TatC
MSAQKRNDDEDDYFKDTRMSLGEHIEELRVALWRAIKCFFLAMLLSFLVAKPALLLICRPVEKELKAFHAERVQEKKKQLKAEGDAAGQPVSRPMTFTFDRNQLAEALGLEARFPPGSKVRLTTDVDVIPFMELTDEIQVEMTAQGMLRTLGIMEGFLVWIKVGIYLGLVFASPLIFYHLWMFVAAGLYPTEKKLVHVYLPLSVLLFLAGVAVCQFLALPLAVRYLLGFNAWLEVEPDLRLSEWLTFAILTPVLFGIAFQTPMVMFAFERLGLLTVEHYRRHRKIAIFVICVLAALLSAAPDPLSMSILAIPMIVLYEFGILLCLFVPKPQPDLEVPDPEEMVEV